MERGPIDAALAHHPPVRPAVSHFVSAANLVNLLDVIDAIRRAATGKDNALDLLQELDKDFPWGIMAPESATATGYEKNKTLDRALDVRISLWILQIQANKAFTEEAAIELGSTLFFGTSGDHVYPNEIDSKTIEFRPIYGVHFDNPSNDEDSDKNMREDVFQAYNRVCQFLAGGEAGKVDLQGLQKAFPLDECLGELFEWAGNLFGEVVETIEKEFTRRTANNAEDVVEPERYECRPCF